MKQQLIAVLRMARFSTLPGGVLAYSLGASMGAAHAGEFIAISALAGLLVTFTTNMVASYADEYADVDTDSLSQRTWFSGGSGVLPAGLVPVSWALRIAILLAVVSLAFTLILIAAGILPAVSFWILSSGLLLGWFYSMPPLQLERRGLGELDNAFIGGILMPLMGYTVQFGRLTWTAVLALLPIFLFVLVGLLGVHWADREADAAVDKRSLAVILGENTRRLHWGLTALAFLLTLALFGWIYPAQVVFAIMLTLPVFIWAALAITRQHSPVPSSLAMAAVLLAATVGWWVVRG